MEPNRILVTGASGFVGRICVSELRRRFCGATIFAAAQKPLEGGIACDLTNRDATTEMVAHVRPDAVLHLAGQASVGSGSAETTWRTNVAGTLNLADAVASHAAESTVVFASSAEVYGQAFNHGEVDEQTTPYPVNAYSRSKLAAEELLFDVLQGKARLIIARPCNHSGPGQDERFVIPSFAAQIARIEAGAEPVLRVGNLEARRDFLHVTDVVAAYCQIIAAADQLSEVSIFNISSEQQLRIMDIVEKLLALTSANIEIVPDQARMRPSEVPETRIDSQRIRKAIGWTPHRTFDEVLSEVLSAQRQLASSRTNV